MLYRFINGLGLALLCTGLQAQTYLSPSKEEFRKLLTAVGDASSPGYSVLVAKNNQIVYQDAVGMADMEQSVPIRPDMVFRIGSITKQFTAVAILQLVEQGKLKLDADIRTYLPDYPTQGKTILLEQLLNHTSGIKSYTSMDSWDGEVRKRDFTVSGLVDFFKNEPSDFEPGTQLRYNNSAYILLGAIIEQVSGISYADYVRRHIFEPAGMTTARYDDALKIIPGRVKGYSRDASHFINAPYLSMTQPYAAGSLLMSTGDLFKWHLAVNQHRLLSKVWLDRAYTPGKLADGSAHEFGYGWARGQLLGMSTIEHSGGINGFSTNAIYLPEQEVYVIVFGNLDSGGGVSDLSKKLAALAVGKLRSPVAIKLSEKEKQAYVAVYRNRGGDSRTISMSEGKLYSQRTGGPRFSLESLDKDEFLLGDGLSTLLFIRDASGRIVSVESNTNEGKQLWQRTDEKVSARNKIAVSTDVLRLYEGVYELMPGFEIKVYLAGEALMGAPTGQQALELHPFEKDRFFVNEVDAQVTFNRDDQQKVVSLTLHQGPLPITGPKIR